MDWHVSLLPRDEVSRGICSGDIRSIVNSYMHLSLFTTVYGLRNRETYQTQVRTHALITQKRYLNSSRVLRLAKGRTLLAVLVVAVRSVTRSCGA